jgi:hypothetical protein
VTLTICSIISNGVQRTTLYIGLIHNMLFSLVFLGFTKPRCWKRCIAVLVAVSLAMMGFNFTWHNDYKHIPSYFDLLG